MLITVKPVLSEHPKIDKMKVLKTAGSLTQVESIAECSLGPALSSYEPQHEKTNNVVSDQV